MTQPVLSHITLGALDLERATHFYDAVLGELGISRLKSGKGFAGWGVAGTAQFFLTLPFDGGSATPGNGVSVSFLALTREAVDRFWQTAMTHGGQDEGKPGLRPQYSPTYYAAYVRDTEGNKIAAVCHT
ncbi:MAG: VOC family protein [Acidisphaera sp.]|nr:VOC family protein [Acidisphaera sp.]